MILQRLEAKGIELGMKHINNTGGVFSYPEYSLDAVRPGIAIYGTHDGNIEEALNFGFRIYRQYKI